MVCFSFGVKLAGDFKIIIIYNIEEGIRK